MPREYLHLGIRDTNHGRSPLGPIRKAVWVTVPTTKYTLWQRIWRYLTEPVLEIW